MYKVCICGHFGGTNDFNDGQTVKTKNLYTALSEIYGKKEVLKVDTYNWKKHPISFLNECKKSLKNSENLVMLPAHNGVKVFVPLFTLLNKRYKRKVFYAVVGGWLPEFIRDRKWLLKFAKKLNKIFVETNKMRENLNELGLDNVEILLNFKDITPIKEEELKAIDYSQLKVCTFSRVIKEKGIENAIDVVKMLNKKFEKTIYKLDIYGPVSDEYKEEFETIIRKQNPSEICYKGIVQSNKSVEVIKQYDLLLFPTYYEGEGLAGTIIDAFFSGVPVVASDWRYNADIIQNEETGLVFKVKNDDEFAKVLENVHLKKYDMFSMKQACLKESFHYLPSEAIKVLIKNIE